MKQYKVELISVEKNRRFGEFNPQPLEDALNEFSRQGWQVISCSARDIPGFGSGRQEFVAVLEKAV